MEIGTELLLSAQWERGKATLCTYPCTPLPLCMGRVDYLIIPAAFSGPLVMSLPSISVRDCWACRRAASIVS